MRHQQIRWLALQYHHCFLVRVEMRASHPLLLVPPILIVPLLFSGQAARCVPASVGNPNYQRLCVPLLFWNQPAQKCVRPIRAILEYRVLLFRTTVSGLTSPEMRTSIRASGAAHYWVRQCDEAVSVPASLGRY
jgi:hypothetical protein